MWSPTSLRSSGVNRGLLCHNVPGVEFRCGVPVWSPTSLRSSSVEPYQFAEFRYGPVPVCGVLVLITDFYVIMYLGNFMFLDKHLLFTMRLTL